MFKGRAKVTEIAQAVSPEGRSPGQPPELAQEDKPWLEDEAGSRVKPEEQEVPATDDRQRGGLVRCQSL